MSKVQIVRHKLVFACSTLMVCLAALQAGANEFVRLEYNLFSVSDRALNTVYIEVFDDRPLTRDNFLQYVDADLYDDTFMHRLARNFVLQGGGFYPTFQQEPSPLFISLDSSDRVDLDGNLATPNPTVDNEFGNSPMRSNLRGTLAMAKLGGDPDSATNQWFFNLDDNSANLDAQNGGFTVFAEVVGNGMTLIDLYNSQAIQTSDLNADINNDGTRDGGPFGTVPNASGQLITLRNAERVRYLKEGETTVVDPTGLTFSQIDTFIEDGHTFDVGTQGRFLVNTGISLGTASDIELPRPIGVLGTLEPGLQIGTLTTSRYDQFDSGELIMQIAGEELGTEYDSLIINGRANLDGDLTVEFIPGYSPEAGDDFTLITAQSFGEDFDNYNLPDLAGGLVWLDPEMTSTTLSIEIGGILGDYNLDGVVDAADYVVYQDTLGAEGIMAADGNQNGVVDAADYDTWRSNFGQGPPLPADFNGDNIVNGADYTVWRDALGATDQPLIDIDGSGMVDTGDYAIWRANFGQSAATLLDGQGTAVPEPSALALLAAAAVAAVWAQKKRASNESVTC